MQVGRNREELEQKLIDVIYDSGLRRKKRVVNDIKTHLAKYDILAGTVQELINDPEQYLPKTDLRQLFLLTEQIYVKTENPSILPSLFFTQVEEKESRQFSGLTEFKQEEISFPITFSNTTVVGNSAYMTTMSIKTIKKLLDNNLIFYNYETQREARYVRRKSSIVVEPTLNKNSVNAIRDHLLAGTLVPTVLTLNCETRSTTHPSGEEIMYNSKSLELTIQENTRVSITDGYHRITGACAALMIEPELDFNFAVMICNFSTRQAQSFMAQISKANPVSTVRIKELEANRFSDNVVKQLREESELRGRISQTNRIHSLNREVVSYNVLSDTIDEQFKMNTKLDSLDVGDYLVEFFDNLLGLYPDEFIHDLDETRKVSLICDNNMFVGYITLARKMYEKGIRAKELRKYIRNIDFSKSNTLWKDLGILDQNENVTDTNKARKAIKQYFENIEVEVNN